MVDVTASSLWGGKGSLGSATSFARMRGVARRSWWWPFPYWSVEETVGVRTSRYDCLLWRIQYVTSSSSSGPIAAFGCWWLVCGERLVSKRLIDCCHEVSFSINDDGCTLDPFGAVFGDPNTGRPFADVVATRQDA